MEDFFIKAVQLIASLSILVVLHELGHFIPAKLFKTRVEKFYLFFDPWFSLFKFKRGDTEYGIGWLPLGGYVKIAGMIDESMDKEQMALPPKPDEFRSKPTWQRLIIMVGGVTVNLLLAMFIYSMTLFVWGEKYLPNENLTDGIWCVDSMAYEVGLMNGDKILSINNTKIEKLGDVMPEMLYGGAMEIERNGSIISIDVPEDFIENLIDNDARQIVYARIPTIVAQVSPESENVGLILPKDQIVSVNGKEVKYYDQLQMELKNYTNENAMVGVIRDSENVELDLFINDLNQIGFNTGFVNYKNLERLGIYEFASLKYGLLASFPAGINKALDKLGSYVRQFKLILNPDTGAYKGLGGFGALGGLFPSSWNWQAFWEITAFLSIILAFMNILPIPALDGGHVMFLLYEMISGRKPGDKFMEYAQLAGFVLLISLLLFANGNDLFRLFK
jgi:regulator of sigma E protease|tara:strand:- start:675 stop:2015 length:1341 start_codon:yes stop_codon:yes gene_type:complete